jgi:RNA polymerase sigma factor (sigma-70 family)
MKENFLTDEASDSELLSAMGADGDLSYSAFDIFYNRYFDDLHSFTFRVFGLFEADRFDLVQDAMLQAFRAATTFKDEDDGNAERMRRRTTAWLGKIATNLHREKYRRQKGTEFESLEKENHETENIEIPSEKIPDAELVWKIRESEDNISRDISANGHAVSLPRKIMREVLAELSEREQEVLLATYEEFDFQKPNQHLSQEKIDELTKRYGISSKNLKQIRYRARKFVFEESLKRFEANQTEIKI